MGGVGVGLLWLHLLLVTTAELVKAEVTEHDCLSLDDRFGHRCLAEDEDGMTKNCYDKLSSGSEQAKDACERRQTEDFGKKCSELDGYKLLAKVNEAAWNTNPCKSICLSDYSKRYYADWKVKTDVFYDFYCDTDRLGNPVPVYGRDKDHSLGCADRAVCTAMRKKVANESTPQDHLEFMENKCTVKTCQDLARIRYARNWPENILSVCMQHKDAFGDVKELPPSEHCKATLRHCKGLQLCKEPGQSIDCLAPDGVRSHRCCKVGGCLFEGGCLSSRAGSIKDAITCERDMCNQIECLGKNGFRVKCPWRKGCSLTNPEGGCGTGNQTDHSSCMYKKDSAYAPGNDCNRIRCYGARGVLLDCPTGGGCNMVEPLGGCGNGKKADGTWTGDSCEGDLCNKITCFNRDSAFIACPKGGGCLTEPPSGGCGDKGDFSCHDTHCNAHYRVEGCYHSGVGPAPCAERRRACCARQPGRRGCLTPRECSQSAKLSGMICFEDYCNPAEAERSPACEPCPAPKPKPNKLRH